MIVLLRVLYVLFVVLLILVSLILQYFCSMVQVTAKFLAQIGLDLSVVCYLLMYCGNKNLMQFSLIEFS